MFLDDTGTQRDGSDRHRNPERVIRQPDRNAESLCEVGDKRSGAVPQVCAIVFSARLVAGSLNPRQGYRARLCKCWHNQPEQLGPFCIK